MEFKKDSNFDNYVEKYKLLPLEEKKQILKFEFEELIAVLSTLNKKCGMINEILFNREILDLQKESATESDFVEAVFVYLHSIKELIASLAERLDK